MLGDDKYLVENKIELENGDTKRLYLLYYPLVKEEALAIYLALVYDLNINFVKLHNLLNYLDFSIDRFEKGLHKLEEVGLVLTYQKDDSYIFELVKPLSLEDFMRHDILSRMLLGAIDARSYKRLYELRTSSSKHKGYKNVSHILEYAHLNKWNKSQEKKYQNIKKVNLEELDVEGFDIKRLIDKIALPNDLKNKDVLEFIARTGRSFGVSLEDMGKYVVDAIDYDKDENGFPCLNPKLNKGRLLYYISKGKHFNLTNSQDPYEKPCTNFLKQLQNNKELTISDYKLIASLSNEYYLKVPVINFLLEYVFLENHGELNPNFIKAIAANWHRLGIDTIEQAKEYLSERQKRLQQKGNLKKDSLIKPDYTIDNSSLMLDDDDFDKYLPK